MGYSKLWWEVPAAGYTGFPGIAVRIPAADEWGWCSNACHFKHGPPLEGCSLGLDIETDDEPGISRPGPGCLAFEGVTDGD